MRRTWIIPGAAVVALLAPAPAVAAPYGQRAVSYWLGKQLTSGAFPAIPESKPAPHYGNTMMALAMALRDHDRSAVVAVQHWI